MTITRKSPLPVALLSLLLLNPSALTQGNKAGTGFSRSNLDETCAPCQDFYRYANGGWLRRHPVPPTQSAWAQFNIVTESNFEKLRVILEAAAANRKDLAALKTLTTNFSWADYFGQIGHGESITKIGEIIVRQPDFFKRLDRELMAAPLADWKAYLRWHALRRFASALPARFEDESFNFYGKYLRGSQEQFPRWRRCVSSAGNAMRDALGARYIEQRFPAEARTRMNSLVDNLLAALREDLATLDWMSAPTRAEALEKLAALRVRIGRPEKWRDYAALKIERGAYAANVMRTAQFLRQDNWDQLGRAVERGKWFVPAWTVDAFASDNAIFFPAGILQSPFFDFTGDDALNYGAIGAMIGHEITHHFDDVGRRFDAKGNLRDWWTAEDARNYAARAACIERQFSSYQAAEGVFHNGRLVLGEASSDLGGLKLALLAYRKSLAGKPAPPLIDGFTGEQRFFLGFALMWAGNARPEWERLRAQTDPHPLARFRVNGTLANTPEFAAAFGCKPGEAMAREEKCEVW